MIYTHGPYRIEADVEKTRAFYRDAPLYDCDCAGCRNFVLAAPQLPAQVLEFFDSFGIDIRKPAEICPLYSEDKETLIYTDIQLKTSRRSVEVFNMKIIMRRDSVIFYLENNRIDNAGRRCLSN